MAEYIPKTLLKGSFSVIGSKLLEETMMKAKCPDCCTELDVPTDTAQGEIVSCPGCGLELEVKQVNGESVDLQELVIEGEDWGE
jgi:alpha-aminoadipate carrier protein LysW